MKPSGCCYGQPDGHDRQRIVAARGFGVKRDPTLAACRQELSRGTRKRVMTPLGGPPRRNPDSLAAMAGPIHHCGSEGDATLSSRSRSVTRALATSNAAAKEFALVIPF
jgi:hypothetical protein